ncbi:MAG TPA: 4Fe-4S binding protein [Deltaproteobacteria bacterium]|nr:4Fe-4S binding protein [Deltaproteobacteria bacterium]HXK46521.1 4Fe-4S binding protein [Deltaproteobacteria bacterium]
MEQQDVYRELSKKLMLEHSRVIPLIWRIICTDEEARIVNRMPATVDELARDFAKSTEEMQGIVDRLFHRGAAFDFVKDKTTFYRGPRHIIQFHDATILWPEAPEEMFRLWEEFEETDYPQLLELVTSINLPSFMRVIPIGETIEVRNQVLSYEDARSMLESASMVAVTTCVCRKLMKRCNRPLEVCLQLNRGAEYTIKRGTGRRVNVQEALEILKKARDAGLVHMTENTSGRSNVLCNCCNCCCEMLRFATDVKTKGVLAPSRFRARVDEAACTACGLCEEICPVEAIAVEQGDAAVVKADACIGCGLCASVCPVEAIALTEARPKEFIPGK